MIRWFAGPGFRPGPVSFPAMGLTREQVRELGRAARPEQVRATAWVERPRPAGPRRTACGTRTP